MPIFEPATPTLSCDNGAVPVWKFVYRVFPDEVPSDMSLGTATAWKKLFGKAVG